MPTRRPLVSALLMIAGFTASACTAILVPSDESGMISSCNTTEDCPESDDNRYKLECVFGEDQPESSSKVCAPAFEEIKCNPEAYGGEHPLVAAHEAALAAKAAYGQCTSPDNIGTQGCPAEGGMVCQDGLEPREDGICDEPGAEIPAVYPPDVGGPDIAGQDALDQFCRWYFCDDSFVCDTGANTWTCKRCSGTDPERFGEGGCGTLYLDGVQSPIYTPLDTANCDGDKGDSQAEFGPAPMP